MEERKDQEDQNQENIDVQVDSPAPESSLRQYSFQEIEQDLTDAYVQQTNNNSTICDIIAVYLKGQKILYTEAKCICEQRLNFLMLPAIFLTVLCSILNLVLQDFQYGSTIVSSFNGCTAFILALINYLKLDAKAEAHRTSAYKFDKLQSFVEFNSAKILFMSQSSRELGKIILEVENNVREIKETNQFILPEKIRFSCPQLYSTNVFSEVKKYKTRKCDTLMN